MPNVVEYRYPHVEDVATGQLPCTLHLLPADGTHFIAQQQLLCWYASEPEGEGARGVAWAELHAMYILGVAGSQQYTTVKPLYCGQLVRAKYTLREHI